MKAFFIVFIICLSIGAMKKVCRIIKDEYPVENYYKRGVDNIDLLEVIAWIVWAAYLLKGL